MTIWAPGYSALTLQGSSSGGGGGAPASVNVTTEYPWGDAAVAVINAPVGTPILLRIPSWAGPSASVCIAGGGCTPAPNGTFFTLRQATPVATYTVNFAPYIRADASFFAGSVAVYRGALLYALGFNETTRVLSRGPQGFNDYAVHAANASGSGSSSSRSSSSSSGAAAAPFNVALRLESLTFVRRSGAQGPPSPQPFAGGGGDGGVQWIEGRGVLVPGWGMVNNSAASPPASPLDCTLEGVCGEELSVRLVPYGTTLLRMAVLPWVKQ